MHDQETQLGPHLLLRQGQVESGQVPHLLLQVLGVRAQAEKVARYVLSHRNLQTLKNRFFMTTFLAKTSEKFSMWSFPYQDLILAPPVSVAIL